MSETEGALQRGPDIYEDGDLATRAVKSAGWVFAGRATRKVLDLVRMVIFARLLGPRDFGLFGVVTITLIALKTFSQTGFDQALIQRKEDTERYLDTVWTVQLARGVLLAFALILTAPVVAGFFRAPLATNLLRAMSLAVLLEGGFNVGTIFFRKNLQFKRLFVLNTLGSVASLAVGIMLAVRLRSAWALLGAAVTGAFASCCLSYLLHPYRPRLNFDRKKASELIRYGKWVLAGAVTTFIAAQLDYVMVGRILSVEVLGVYVLAYRISLLPIQEVTYTVARVALPSYAKLQGDPERIRTAYNRLFQLTTFLSVPACIGTMMIAPRLVTILLGAKWHGVILPLQILMIAQLLKSVCSTGSPLFLGSGNPKYEFSMQFFRALALAATLYPLLIWAGIAGGAWAVVVSSGAMLVAFGSMIGKIAGVKISQLAAGLIIPVIGSALMSLFLWGMFGFFKVYNVLNLPLVLTGLPFFTGPSLLLRCAKLLGAMQLGGVVAAAAALYFALGILLSLLFRRATIAYDVGTILRTAKNRFLGERSGE